MISVCLASYNGEKYIKEQIETILDQIGIGDELIISDDGSTDNTISIIKDFNDSRIKLVNNNNVHGYTSNFYNALLNATGDYIFLSDQDDIWLPNKVEKVLNALIENDFVHSDAIIVDENKKVICSSRNKEYGVKSGFLNILLKSRYIGCCMAFKKNVLESIFPVPTYTNSLPHDIWIPLIAEKYFKAKLLDEPLILYRRHMNNTSNGGVSSDRSVFEKIKSRKFYLFSVMRQRKTIRKNVRSK